ncbi:hypothetical protein HPHPH18_1404 [Helicobacter pylori Hp H-18]|nr:hypothetical protein HPHPH18_1470 [Helicobacter pylori Hp H-18]EJB88248.1 hypothetical protein HPHPH18_1404 [Helicobacter pylori Hp H-18]
MRFVISKAHGSNQSFFLKNKNAQKRFLRRFLGLQGVR